MSDTVSIHFMLRLFIVTAFLVSRGVAQISPTPTLSPSGSTASDTAPWVIAVSVVGGLLMLFGLVFFLYPRCHVIDGTVSVQLCSPLETTGVSVPGAAAAPPLVCGPAGTTAAPSSPTAPSALPPPRSTAPLPPPPS